MGYFVKFIKKILGIKRPSKIDDLISPTYPIFIEKDTKCDLCDNRSECEDYLIDCTHSEDTRRHVINGIGHICPKDIKHTPFAISCNGDFTIDDEPCTSCDVYRKFKNKEDKNDQIFK